MAEKLLACMQADVEKGIFRIEKYTKEVPTNVVPYLEEWAEEEKPHLSPATYKDYINSIRNHLIPWNGRNPVQLHEIQYDVLCRSGKYQTIRQRQNERYVLPSQMP